MAKKLELPDQLDELEDELEDALPLTVDQERAKLLAAREYAGKLFESAKLEYNLFNKNNPLTVAKQPTAHELRVIREKLGSSTSYEHAKVNAAQAAKVSRDNLLKAAKGK